MDENLAKEYLNNIGLEYLSDEIIKKSKRDIQSLPDFKNIPEQRKESLFQGQVKFRVELINRATQQALEQGARKRKFRQTVINYGLSNIWL